MLKVHILDRCESCQWEAYVFVGEFDDEDGNRYPRYLPCHVCKGTGELGKWVSLPDFLEMLKATQCKHEHTSFRGGMHFYAGDVWDDIQEICNDCGANLDQPTLDDFIQDDH